MKVEIEIPDGICTKWNICVVAVVTVIVLWIAYIQIGPSPTRQIQYKSNPVIKPTATTASETAARKHQLFSKSMIPQPGILNNNSARSDAVIMCMIFTMPSHWDELGLAVRLTWSKRCDYYAFFYSKSNEVTLQGAYALDVPEGREHLTAKTMKAFQISYAKYGSSVDWYLKADDDTYVIVENLRALVSMYNSSKPVYLGHTGYDILSRGYNSGGAGYVLSSEAVRLMAEGSDKLPSYCVADGEIEDLDMGRCLQAFRIFPTETRDSIGRITFHPDHPLKLLQGKSDAMDVYQYTKYNYTFGNYKGIRVLSPLTVSFHYVDAGHMYMYDYLLYELLRDYRT